jgi:hypothetical protein
MVRAESIAANHGPIFTALGGKEFATRLRKQLLSYAWTINPFDKPLPDNRTLAWWTSLQAHPEASCLAVRNFNGVFWA